MSLGSQIKIREFDFTYLKECLQTISSIFLSYVINYEELFVFFHHKYIYRVQFVYTIWLRPRREFYARTTTRTNENNNKNNKLPLHHSNTVWNSWKLGRSGLNRRFSRDYQLPNPANNQPSRFKTIPVFKRIPIFLALTILVSSQSKCLEGKGGLGKNGDDSTKPEQPQVRGRKRFFGKIRARYEIEQLERER